MNYLQPIYIEKFKIYDIFHNDNNELVVIMPYIHNPYIIKYNDTPLELYRCPHSHTLVYKCVTCYTDTVNLSINDCIVNTAVNKYLSFKDQIVFSTIVKDEDQFIISWIDFHLKMGVSNFIIYDNSTNSTLPGLLESYKDIVLLIKWNYPYFDGISGISGQTTQQNHSIHAFRNSKYIGLFDIDEYINMKGVTDINEFLEIIIKKENVNINETGSFRLLNKFFYNPYNLPVNDGQFLKIFNCDELKHYGNEKNFVLPKNVNTFSVHMITSGKEMYNVNEKYGYFNHYFFLNKTTRGRNKTNLTDNSLSIYLNN